MGKIVSLSSSLQPAEAYLASPNTQSRGGVIVIHEVWGLDDHIKSVADRLAAEGYTALAPSLINLENIEPGELKALQLDLFNPEKRTAVQPKLREIMAPIQNPQFGQQTTEKLKDCYQYLFDLEETNQKVAVMGFCFGGTYSFNLAVAEPALNAAIAFYGHADQDVAELEAIQCPIQAFYGENDERLVSGLPELEAKMTKAGVNFSYKVYPNCGHAFFNDSNPYSYNEAAALDAWQKTLEILAESLG